MKILDLLCKNSVSFSKSGCNDKINDQILYLGGCYNYLSCLYFAIPPCLFNKDLKSAKLILYKYPISQSTAFNSKCDCYNECDCCWECCYYEDNNNYIAAPLLEFFSAFSSFYCIPRVDLCRKIEFVNYTNLCYTEVDITEIVKAWSDGDLENKGIMLAGSNGSNFIGYGSEKSDIPGIRPILRLVYKEFTLCQKLSSTPCSVKVR